jgi:hypothetical protein
MTSLHPDNMSRSQMCFADGRQLLLLPVCS